MFKYVEHMRKDALFIMSRTYGIKNKATGEPFYDSYPLETLVNLLCYENLDEARQSCQHYGIKIDGDQVLWRHSKFMEPRDPVKGNILTLKPRKMIRTIESKLNGGTRLSVCRGGHSGEGATLSRASLGKESFQSSELKSSAVLMSDIDRQKAREAIEQARRDAMEKEKFRQKEEAAMKEAERQRFEAMAKEKLKARQLEVERQQKARLEAKRQAEEERIQRERQAEAEKQERERREEENRQRQEEEARMRQAREREEARQRMEAEKQERARQLERERKRKEEEEKLRQSRERKAAAERKRKLEEEKMRKIEEEKLRIALELERRRKAEEERLRKEQEEEERRIEMKWRMKIATARKLMIWRLWRKLMHKHENVKKSMVSLGRLDPTLTRCPSSLTVQAPRIVCQNVVNNSRIATNYVTVGHFELERQIYRLATASKEPFELTKLVEHHILNSLNSHCRYLSHDLFPPIVQTNQQIELFKLVVLLPKEIAETKSLYDSLVMWINSHFNIGEVSSSFFKRQSRQIEVRAVAVNGNEDMAACNACSAALFILPSFSGDSSYIQFPEETLQLLDTNIPRMALVLSDDESRGKNCHTEQILNSVIGESSDAGAIYHQRHGVVTPKTCNFDIAFRKCCSALIESHFEVSSEETIIANCISHPTFTRVSLANIGCLCLQRLIQNMEAELSYKTSSTSHNLFFAYCKKTLEQMIHELLSIGIEIQNSKLVHWPPREFLTERSRSIDMFFDRQFGLPFDWYLPLLDNLSTEKVFDIFQHILDMDSFSSFVESICPNLPPSIARDILLSLDSGDIVNCFTSIVALIVNGEMSIDLNDDDVLYLPIEKLTQVINRSSIYEASPIPKPRKMHLGITDFLLPGKLQTLEKNKNIDIQNTQESLEVSPSLCSKRKSPEKNQGLVKCGATAHSSKRIRTDTSIETEEEKRSKEFTALLESLLS